MSAEVAVLRTGALGDVLLGLPALRVLRRKFPRERIVFVAPLPQARFALRGGLADEVVSFDDPAIGPLFTGHARALPHFLAGTRLAVIWQRSWSDLGSTLTRLGVNRAIGTAPIPPPAERVHAADWLIRSLSSLDVAVDVDWDSSAWLAVSDDDRSTAAEALGQAGVSGPYVVLHPGSGSRRKNWPASQWASVIERLPRDTQLVITAGPADEDAVTSLNEAWPRSARPAIQFPAVPLDTLAGVLASATLYLGNDSGVTHLAAATGAPAIAVFGPTDPAIWRPRGPRVTVLGGAPASGSDGIFASEPSWPTVDQVAEAALSRLSV